MIGENLLYLCYRKNKLLIVFNNMEKMWLVKSWLTAKNNFRYSKFSYIYHFQYIIHAYEELIKYVKSINCDIFEIFFFQVLNGLEMCNEKLEPPPQRQHFTTFYDLLLIFTYGLNKLWETLFVKNKSVIFEITFT